jgi:hypothetical protein
MSKGRRVPPALQRQVADAYDPETGEFNLDALWEAAGRPKGSEPWHWLENEGKGFVFGRLDEGIDGRNRWRACEELSIKPITRIYAGPTDMASLVSFVVSLNLKRRHLNSGQLAFVALNIEKALATEAQKNMVAGGVARQQGSQKIANPVIRAAEQAAEIAGTNHTYVRAAKKITKDAPDLATKVQNGETSITDAKRELKGRTALSP